MCHETECSSRDRMWVRPSGAPGHGSVPPQILSVLVRGRHDVDYPTVPFSFFFFLQLARCPLLAWMRWGLQPWSYATTKANHRIGETHYNRRLKSGFTCFPPTAMFTLSNLTEQETKDLKRELLQVTAYNILGLARQLTSQPENPRLWVQYLVAEVS